MSTPELLQNNTNPFALQQARQAPTEAMVSRQAQEVQAAMVIAKKFPRDEAAAYNRIMNACRRPALAEEASYAFPRGDTTVEGPSIRLAEALAQAWGNIDFGIIELEQKNGESSVMAYAWDLEANTRQTKIFTVKHERKTKKGIFKLDDPRDIYEMTANQGARRLRSCILGVIPGDVIEAAQIECDRTLKGESKEPLCDRIKKMVVAYGEFGVGQAQIEKRLGHKVDTISEAELQALKKIYRALRDNMADRSSYFDFNPEAKAPDLPKSPDEPAEAAAGLAPEPKKEPTNTPRSELAALLEQNGITYSALQKFASESNFYPDADSYASLDELPLPAMKRLLNAKSGLIAQLGKKEGK